MTGLPKLSNIYIYINIGKVRKYSDTLKWGLVKDNLLTLIKKIFNLCQTWVVYRQLCFCSTHISCLEKANEAGRSKQISLLAL